MHKKIILLMMLFVSVAIAAQNGEVKRSVIASAGGSMKSENYSVSWTLGEVVTGTVKNSEIKINQGFHQRPLYPICTKDSNCKIIVYPNPTSDFIYVFVESFEGKIKPRYELVDLSGKILYQGQFKQNNKKIDMRPYSAGVYILHIEDDYAVISHSIKIVKE